ncbi:MAG: hypothetical protein N3A65_01175 [candidate division WOR-3 bacterium]|nr:hypothetical protein [candidate division WOR-3 bacterium]
MKFAIFIIFLALFFWLGNLGVVLPGRDWPVILIFFGFLNLILLPRYSRKKIIEDLEKGRITPEEALKRLERLH